MPARRQSETFLLSLLVDRFQSDQICQLASLLFFNKTILQLFNSSASMIQFFFQIISLFTDGPSVRIGFSSNLDFTASRLNHDLNIFGHWNIHLVGVPFPILVLFLSRIRGHMVAHDLLALPNPLVRRL